MAAQENWWEGSPVVAKPNKAQQVDGGVYVPPTRTPEQQAEERRENIRLGISQQGADIAARGEVRDIESTKRSGFLDLVTKYEGDDRVVKYQKVLPIYDAMLSVASRPNPSKADDNILITQFSKIKDPTTGVLGGEFETSKDVQTLFDKYKTDLQGLYDPATGFVSPAARQQFIRATKDLVASDRTAYNAARSRYSALAQNPLFGVNPEEVIGEDFANAYRDKLISKYIDIMGGGPEATDKGIIDLKVAEGDRFATDRDIEVASILQGMWQSGKSIDELNAKSIELTGGAPLAESTINALRNDPNRTIRWTPARSGIREGSASQIGPGEAAAAAAVRGYTSNLGEEILSIFSKETGSKLQAAGEAGMEQYPIISALTEIPSSIVSPINKLTKFVPGGPVVRDIVEGAIYGGGEGRLDANALERAKTAASGGALQSAFGAAGRRFLPGGATPEGAGIPEGEFVNVTGEVPTGMAPDIGMGGQAAPSPTTLDIPTGAPAGAPAGMAPTGAGQPQYVIPEAPSQLNKPRIPTKQEMEKLSSVQNVDLASVRRGQDVYAIQENMAGKYAEPLIEGFGDIPVGVRLENGEIIAYDGNHRVALALGQGRDKMPMYVIDAKNFDPANQGLKASAYKGMSDEEMLAELGADLSPSAQPTAPSDVTAQIGSEEMINLAQKAVSRGPGASKARAQLAEMAKTNPEARAAADRLGLELPVDVLSDNSQLKEVVGLTRAQIGSEAKQAWNETVQAASERAHKAMDELDAVTDISQVSADVFDRLDNANQGLSTKAANLRDEVTGAIDSRGRVDVGSVKTWLQNRIDDLGGGKEGIANLSAEEKRLWATVSKANPTYAALNEQRDLIGQALEKTTGPWANSNTKKLKEIYGALANDQINFIESTAGKEIADKQRAANTLFKQMYEGREQMERIFTKNLSGSLAPLMQRAITQGTKGNVQTLNTLVKIIPEDMRGKVLTSALFKAAKATDETFSFTNFANIYRDLRANSAVYKQVAEAVGPEGDKLLTDLYAVSRRLSDADKAISRTGASNQLNLLNSERLLSRILMASGGAAGAGLIGSVLGGPGAAIVGAGLAAAAPEIAQRLGKTNAQKLHNLISSEPFRDLTVSAATGDALERNVNRVAGSKQFRDYAKLVGIDMKDARNWLNSAISKGATIAGTEVIGENPEAPPTVEMPQ